MEPSVQIALIVAIFGFSGPALLAVVQYVVHTREKRQDYARQDAVATQAAEAARLLSERQDSAAAKAAAVAKSLLTSNEQVAENAKTAASAAVVVNDKLDDIHALVNSTLTAALQKQLAATSLVLVLMRELVDLHKAAGREPSEKTIAEMKSAEIEISELRATLSDRLKA